MLRRFPTLLLCLFFAFAFAACDSGEDGDNNGNGNGNGTPPSAGIEATIDGNAFTGTLVAIADRNNDGSFDVVGSDGTGSLGITVETAATGTYAMGAQGTTGSYILTTGEAFTTALGGSGTVTVTSISDERVAGTFSFTANSTLGNTTSVTNGGFNVAFTPE